jgi:hypothetical protein
MFNAVQQHGLRQLEEPADPRTIEAWWLQYNASHPLIGNSARKRKKPDAVSVATVCVPSATVATRPASLPAAGAADPPASPVPGRKLRWNSKKARLETDAFFAAFPVPALPPEQPALWVGGRGGVFGDAANSLPLLPCILPQQQQRGHTAVGSAATKQRPHGKSDLAQTPHFHSDLSPILREHLVVGLPTGMDSPQRTPRTENRLLPVNEPVDGRDRVESMKAAVQEVFHKDPVKEAIALYKAKTTCHNTDQTLTENDELHQLRLHGEVGTVEVLSTSYHGKGKPWARYFTVPIDPNSRRRYRNDIAAVTLVANYVMLVFATLQTAEHGYALLTPDLTHRFRGFNLKACIREVIKHDREFLLKLLEPGRKVRGTGLNDGQMLSMLVKESVMEHVHECITSLQEKYKDTPNIAIRFELRQNLPLHIPAVTFNRDTARTTTVYTRGYLERKVRGGMLNAQGRVTFWYDSKKKRGVLCYQPKLSHAIEKNVTVGEARRLQVAAVPGGLKLEHDASGTRYTVHKREATETERVFSVDPGGRTQATGTMLNTGQSFETGGAQRNKEALLESDRLLAKSNSVPAGHLQRFLRAEAQTVRTKMSNWVTESHHQLAQFFVDNTDLVFLPKLQTGGMVRRVNERTNQPRTINGIASRQLLSWRHGALNTKVLKSKMRFYPACCVLDVNESYTTKSTCVVFCFVLYCSIIFDWFCSLQHLLQMLSGRGEQDFCLHIIRVQHTATP